MPGETFTPDVPGRGAWTLQGGLISNSGGVTGYYQTPERGQEPPGLRRDTDSAYCVHLAVGRIQAALRARLDEPDLRTDGVWGPATQAAMLAWQEDADIEPASGVFGPNTAKWFWRPQIKQAARRHQVPWRFLYGMTGRESLYDPAAVGASGWDHGLVQINLDPRAHGRTVSRKEALSPAYCYDFAASDLAQTHDRWDHGRTDADPWDIAIANHNSPLLAQKWAVTGEPPYVEGRQFQIEQYVIDIRARGDAA